MVFSLTRKSSDTPSAASHCASSIISVGRLETNEPRNIGIAQNEHLRSQPEAIFNGAIGALSKRLRASGWLGEFNFCRSAGAIGRSALRSFGLCAAIDPPLIIVCNRAEISS